MVELTLMGTLYEKILCLCSTKRTYKSMVEQRHLYKLGESFEKKLHDLFLLFLQLDLERAGRFVQSVHVYSLN